MNLCFCLVFEFWASVRRRCRPYVVGEGAENKTVKNKTVRLSGVRKASGVRMSVGVRKALGVRVAVVVCRSSGFLLLLVRASCGTRMGGNTSVRMMVRRSLTATENGSLFGRLSK